MIRFYGVFICRSVFLRAQENFWSPEQRYRANIRLKRSRSRSPPPMMENGKLTAAQSMESIDNMSTTSAVPPAQVRTLFVSGLPMDAKPRELYLLFRAYSGYESSLLKITSKNGKTASPVGFVTFSTKAEADEARKALQGVRFDPDNAQTIRLELARSNTKVSKPKQISPPVIPNGPSSLPQAMLQSAAAAPHQFVAPLPTSHAHDLATAAACLDPHMAPFLTEHQLLALSTLPQFAQTPLLFPTAAGIQIPSVASSAAAAMFQPNAAALAQLTAASQAAAQLSAVSQAAIAATASTAACSTLFVANLGQSVNEEELKQVDHVFCSLFFHPIPILVFSSNEVYLYNEAGRSLYPACGTCNGKIAYLINPFFHSGAEFKEQKSSMHAFLKYLGLPSLSDLLIHCHFLKYIPYDFPFHMVLAYSENIEMFPRGVDI